jgi:hypothetical protein
VLEVIKIIRKGKEEMTLSNNRIIDLLDSADIDKNAVEKEIFNFLSHFSVIKSFLPKEEQNASYHLQQAVEIALTDVNFYRDLIKMDLRDFISFNVDYNNLPYRKKRYSFKILGQKGEGEIEK